MNFIKNKILRILLQIIRRLKGDLKIIINGRSIIKARVYRVSTGKWSDKIILNNKPKIKL